MNKKPILMVAGLAFVCLLAPNARSQDRTEAARVAKKVEKAKTRAAREAKEEQEAVRHFQKRLGRYAQIHASHLARLGGEKAVTAQALAQAIAKDRAKAKQGDIFFPEIQPLLRKLIAEQLQGPGTLAAQEAVKEGNPDEAASDSVPVIPRVNAVYPMGATRSTVPPSVLLILPPLPESLHYRFVGRDLLLVDSVAQVIVDFITNAAPIPAVRSAK